MQAFCFPGSSSEHLPAVWCPFIQSNPTLQILLCFLFGAFVFFVGKKNFMNTETAYIAEQLKQAFDGDPWFGRSAQALLAEVDEKWAFEKPGGQHSILELVWHMVTWREFTISRFQSHPEKDLHYFELNDWRKLDHADKSLWQQGLERLSATQKELLVLVEGLDDKMLERNVGERNYDFRKLLNGIVQHDIYHLGQIAYIKKLMENK